MENVSVDCNQRPNQSVRGNLPASSEMFLSSCFQSSLQPPEKKGHKLLFFGMFLRQGFSFPISFPEQKTVAIHPDLTLLIRSIRTDHSEGVL